jgi:hypothetical protein
MEELSAAGQQTVNEAAARHHFRPAAVAGLLKALIAGHGRMAQFDDPEFGGHGQWMRGGMTMIGDMFNSALKARVEQLCDELADIVVATTQTDDGRLFISPPASADHWWPTEFGRPDSAGAQNDIRYAYFSGPQRLAIDRAGAVTIYDTLDHRIEGVAQHGRHGMMTFSTRRGPVDLASLPVVAGKASAPPVPDEPASPLDPDVSAWQPASDEHTSRFAPDIFEAIEKLARLHGRGILNNAEFAEKKAELLSRL